MGASKVQFLMIGDLYDTITENSATDSQWLTFCRRYFQMHFSEWKVLIELSRKFLSMGLVDDESEFR